MGLNKKIRIAFIKFGGLAAAGTERWLQYMAANLPKDEFEVDYYYCNSFPYFKIKGSETNRDRFNYMREKGVNLIQFTVKKINSDCYPARWEETDFWDVFDSRKYDFVQTGKAGAREYPYFEINLPVGLIIVQILFIVFILQTGKGVAGLMLVGELIEVA